MKTSLLFILGLAVVTTVANAQTQPPNAGFETWEPATPFNQLQEPVEWNTSNKCTDLLNIAPVTKSTDAHSGTYSAKLETKNVTGIKANGILTTADIICLSSSGGQEGGMSYTDAFPDSLVGWYKYAPSNNDSAYSQIMFLSNNDQDTLCYTRLNLHAAAQWTRFSVALCPGVSGSAETLSLFFSSSWGDGSQGQAEVGSTLFLDDIAFVNGEVGVDEHSSIDVWSVYPNPVVGELNIRVENGVQASIELFDVTGKLVKKQMIGESNNKITVNHLVAGVYLYQVRSLENEVMRTGKLFVNP
jgi:hypothetical protein